MLIAIFLFNKQKMNRVLRLICLTIFFYLKNILKLLPCMLGGTNFPPKKNHLSFIYFFRLIIRSTS